MTSPARISTFGSRSHSVQPTPFVTIRVRSRMRVPCGPWAWLERDDCPAGAGQFLALNG